MHERPIGWDVESHLIKPGCPAPRLVCLSAVTPDGERLLFDREQGLDYWEERIAPNPNVAHHAFFDLGVVAAERERLIDRCFEIIERGDTYCTKIRQMMIDNAEGVLKFIWNEEREEFEKQNYQLWRLVARHTGRNIWKKKEGSGDIWRLRYSELCGRPISEYPVEAAEYAISDSDDAQMVWDKQEEFVGGDDIPGFVSQMEAAWALNLMSTWGLRTDAAMIREYKKDLEHQFAEQVKTCREYGLRRGPADDVGSILREIQEAPKERYSRDMKKIRAAIERWYKDHDREMKITPKGQIATDREQLTDTDHPGLNAVAGSVKTGKLLTTYVPALERGTQVPLNPNYNPIIETYRTSCSGGMKYKGVPVGMNVQNLPRGGKVRQCVIPRPGNVFVFCDYDTLEMRTLAQVCIDLFGYSDIAEAIRADQDTHVALAAEILGMGYREALALKKAGNLEMAVARQYSKIGNYGMMGGMGPDAFIAYAKGYGIIIERELAVKIHGGFRRKWTEMQDYFAYCSSLCDGGDAEYVVFPRSDMVRGRVRYTAVCNGNFQHLAAMGAKAALYAVVKECYCDPGSPLYGCRPWLFAHDEIGMEVPYEAVGPRGAHEAAMRLKEIMVEKMEFWVPDVPVGASAAMTRRWYKGAPAKLENGIMVPAKPVKKGDKTIWEADL